MEDYSKERPFPFPREFMVIECQLIDPLGAVVIKGTNASRRDVYDVSTSFSEVTQWYTDSLPKENRTNSIEQGLDWIAVMSAVRDFPSD